MEEQMTVNTDGWHKQPHYTQLAPDVMESIQENGWKMDRLVSVTDPILKKPLESCSIGLDRKELQTTLQNAMEHHQGIGLSANQIGIKERAFIMYSDVKKKEIISCFDPLITDYSEEKIIMDEGCLTWPGLWLKVERSEGIRCVYNDVDGELVQVQMHGLESRIFQHEYDHMEGTNFTQRVSKLKLNMAKRRASKMQKRSILTKTA
jgi:peptide deformylase|tara:strand:+ start:101 stop:718 length:618 start_codon:yes stop_codon:yes gene_type:complete